jgi:hypothetical protein
MIVIKFHTEDDGDTTVMNVSRWVIKLKQYILLSHSIVFLAKYPVAERLHKFTLPTFRV